MKKLLILLLCTVSIPAFAVPDEKPDTTFTFNDKKFVINDSTEFITVNVYQDTTSLEKIYEARFNNGNRHETWQLNESITFPFSDLIGNNEKKRNRMKPHWSGIGFGFCQAMDGMSFINKPNGVSINFSRSYEIFWNIFSYRLTKSKRNYGLVSGIGLDWRNYVMDDNRYFVKENQHILIQPCNENMSLKYSRLKTLDITIPLLFEWQPESNRNFFFSIGPVMNIKTYSSLKTLYKIEDTEHKIFHKNINPNPVNMDILLQAGYSFIGFYAKYSPFNIMQSKYGPDMQSFSTGIMLLF